MMVSDFQQEGRHEVRCLFGAGPVPEAYSPYRSENARRTQLPRPGGRSGWGTFVGRLPCREDRERKSRMRRASRPDCDQSSM